MKFWFVCVALALSACATTAPHLAQPPQPSVTFLDVQRFDTDLRASLGAPLPRVDVTFYDRVTPNALPQRLQRWMGAVESGGGKVEVVPPPSSVNPKGLLLLISAGTALWSGQKMAREVAAEAGLRAAYAYNAQLILKQDEQGNVFVERLVFVQRAR